MKFWPMEVEHGWIVGVSIVDTDVDPSVLTHEGAETLAAALNDMADTAKARLIAIRSYLSIMENDNDADAVRAILETPIDQDKK